MPHNFVKNYSFYLFIYLFLRENNHYFSFLTRSKKIEKYLRKSKNKLNKKNLDKPRTEKQNDALLNIDLDWCLDL